ncbi:ABC transporter permease [Nakamurella sp. YIM 132087]|uniref:Transport permease protein n=1 Tax=Nakamurella alba TaxID=2665158 RepID=A0A7K1FNE2_9ACTN|nr:ABC transporter permease [Nakamurella alba]MTD15648.1 ABC transporter permease [Nakamurella alba]
MSAALVMTGRSLRHAVRSPDGLLIGALLPVMIMLLMTTVFGGAMRTPAADYIDYVVPGVILLCAGYGASTTAISVSADLREGMVDRLRTMDLRPSSVLTGHVAASVLRNLVSVLLVIGTAVAVGFRPSAGPLQWLAAAGLVGAYVLALSWAAAAVGLVARTPESASAFGFLLLFLPYLSSAFVPVDTLPGWLQPIAQHQPVSPVTEALRGLLLGGPVAGPALTSLLWCAGILLVSGVLAAWLWQRTRR